MSNTEGAGPEKDVEKAVEKAVDPVTERLHQVTEDLAAHLAAQRADGLAGERWQARLTGIESRLAGVENALTVEADRLRGATAALDALGSRLNAGLSGADALAAAGGNLDARLERLEAIVEALPAAGAERERAVAGALDSLTAQLNRFTAALGEELRANTAAAVEAGLQEARSAAEAHTAPVEALRSELALLAEKVDPAALAAPVLDRTALLTDSVSSLHRDLEALALGVRGVRDDLARAGETPPELEQRLTSIETGMAASERRTAMGVDGLSDVLAQVSAGLAALRADVGARGESITVDDLAPVAAAVAALSAQPPALTAEEMREALASIPQPPPSITTAELAPLVAEIGALAARPDAATAEEIRAAISFELASRAEPATAADVQAAVAELAERLAAAPPVSDAGASAEVARLADAVAELTARPALSSDDLEPIAASLGALQAFSADELRGIADALAELRSQPMPDLTSLSATLADLAARPAPDVGALAGALADLGARPLPLTAADLAPIHDALAELRDRPVEIDGGTTDLDAVVGVLSELRDRPPPATADDVAAALAAAGEQPTAMARDVAERVNAALDAMRLAIVEDLRAVAAGLARLAARPDPVTADDLAGLQAGLGAPALPGAEHDDAIRAALVSFRESIAEDVARIHRAIADATTPVDDSAILESLTSLRASLDEDLRAVASGLARLAARPDPIGAEEIRAAISFELAGRDHSTTADDLDAIAEVLRTSRVAAADDLDALQAALARLADAPAAATVDDVARAVDAVAVRTAAAVPDLGELTATVAAIRSELASVVGRPTGATPDDVRLVADHLTRALGDIRDEIRAVRSASAQVADDGAVAELTEQLDAVGRVLQDVIASLHRIEDGTVGSTPRRERSRQTAIAAVGDLRAARRRHTESGEPDDPDAPVVSG